VVRIEWSDLALTDLDRLDAFLRPKNPQAADNAYFAIYQAAAQLADFPEIGRPALDMRFGYRELPVPFSNSGYTILYYYDTWVSIVRVRHQREADY
jgi:plasmid stabilization system protein ParE